MESKEALFNETKTALNEYLQQCQSGIVELFITSLKDGDIVNVDNGSFGMFGMCFDSAAVEVLEGITVMKFTKGNTDAFFTVIVDVMRFLGFDSEKDMYVFSYDNVFSLDGNGEKIGMGIIRLRSLY